MSGIRAPYLLKSKTAEEHNYTNSIKKKKPTKIEQLTEKNKNARNKQLIINEEC